MQGPATALLRWLKPFLTPFPVLLFPWVRISSLQLDHKALEGEAAFSIPSSVSQQAIATDLSHLGFIIIINY